MNRIEKTKTLVLTALMACLVLLATMAIRIPSPFTQGYIHLGDALIFISVLLLGKKYGAAAAGLGSAMADVMGGFAMYAPWTLVIKGFMAFVMGLFVEMSLKKKKNHIKIAGVPLVQIVGMIIGGVFMALGYGVVDGFLAGNMVSGILGIPFNVIQFVVGLILANIIVMTLYKTPAKNIFAYRLDEIK